MIGDCKNMIFEIQERRKKTFIERRKKSRGEGRGLRISQVVFTNGSRFPTMSATTLRQMISSKHDSMAMCKNRSCEYDQLPFLFILNFLIPKAIDSVAHNIVSNRLKALRMNPYIPYITGSLVFSLVDYNVSKLMVWKPAIYQ